MTQQDIHRHRFPVVLYLLFVFCVLLGTTIAIVNGDEHRSDDRSNSDKSDVKVEISSECAAVLLVGGSAVGGISATTLLPQLLSMLGFASVGVSSDSVAAWWKSILGSVPAGSLFATLQSITMAGGGVGTLVSGAELGGSANAAHVRTLCNKVDTIDPNSPAAQILSKLVDGVRISSVATNQAKEWADYVSNDVLQSERYRNAEKMFHETREELMQSKTYQAVIKQGADLMDNAKAWFHKTSVELFGGTSTDFSSSPQRERQQQQQEL